VSWQDFRVLAAGHKCFFAGHGVPDLVKNNSPSGEILIGYAYKGAQAGSSQKAKIR